MCGAATLRRRTSVSPIRQSASPPSRARQAGEAFGPVRSHRPPPAAIGTGDLGVVAWQFILRILRHLRPCRPRRAQSIVMGRRWILALLCCVTLPSCAKPIAEPVNEPLLAPPPHSAELVSSSRNGRGPGGVGGFETSANAFVVYASTDPRDTLVSWYRNLTAADYRYDVQDKGNTVEITAFSKRDATLHANVTMSSDLPTNVINVYTSASTKI